MGNEKVPIYLFGIVTVRRTNMTPRFLVSALRCDVILRDCRDREPGKFVARWNVAQSGPTELRRSSNTLKEHLTHTYICCLYGSMYVSIKCMWRVVTLRTHFQLLDSLEFHLNFKRCSDRTGSYQPRWSINQCDKVLKRWSVRVISWSKHNPFENETSKKKVGQHENCLDAAGCSVAANGHDQPQSRRVWWKWVSKRL